MQTCRWTSFQRLYQVVWLSYPVINYGASVWGYKSYSCINAVQNRAMRFFLGIGKYTPVAALEGKTGWEPSHIKQWTCIGWHFVRISCTPVSSINKRIALWVHSKASPTSKNWFYYIKERLSKLHLNTDQVINRPIGTEFVKNLREAGLNEFKTLWFNSIHRATGPSGRGRNKLRTYCLFKAAFETEPYCKLIMPLRHCAAFNKFGCGVAPLRIETGRYENKPLEQRKCPFCVEVESGTHVFLNIKILYTPLYPDPYPLYT